MVNTIRVCYCSVRVRLFFSWDWNRWRWVIVSSIKLCICVQHISISVSVSVCVLMLLLLFISLSMCEYFCFSSPPGCFDSIVLFRTCCFLFTTVRNESTSDWIMAMTKLSNWNGSMVRAGVACFHQWRQNF